MIIIIIVFTEIIHPSNIFLRVFLTGFSFRFFFSLSSSGGLFFL